MKYLLIICLVFILTNCTIQKRLYNKGYHVEWNKKSFKTVETTDQASETVAVETEIQIEGLDSGIVEMGGSIHLTDTETAEMQVKAAGSVKKVIYPKKDKTKLLGSVSTAPAQRIDQMDQSKDKAVLKKINKSANKSGLRFMVLHNFGRFMINSLGFILGFILAPFLTIAYGFQLFAGNGQNILDKNRYEKGFGKSYRASYSSGVYWGIHFFIIVYIVGGLTLCFLPYILEFGFIAYLTALAALALGTLLLALLFWLLFHNCDWTFPNFGWNH